MKESTDRPVKTESAQSFKPQFVIDFILEIARHLKTRGLAEIDAICIARDTIEIFEKENRGTTFWFNKRSKTETEIRFNKILVGQLVCKGLKSSTSKQIASTACDRIFFKYGGEKIYVPKARGEGVEARNAEIVAEYLKKPGHRTVKMLAVRFNLSQSPIYEIIRKAGKTQQGSGRKRKAAVKEEELHTT